MKSGITSAGEAYLNINADISDLKAGLEAGKKEISNFSKQASTIDVSIMSQLAGQFSFEGLKWLATASNDLLLASDSNHSYTNSLSALKAAMVDSGTSSSSYSDSISELKAAFTEAGTAIASAFLPAITSVVSSVTPVISSFSELIAAYPGVIKGFGAIAVAATSMFGGVYVFNQIKECSILLISGTKAVYSYITAMVSAATSITAVGAAGEVAAAKVSLLGKAMAVISAHPIMAIATAIAAVAVVIGAYALTTQHYQAQLKDSMTQARQEIERTVGEEVDLLSSLEDLSKKQLLTNSEFKQSNEILDKLCGKYGNLGASIDVMTGKIVFSADAYRNLAKAQKEAYKEQLKLEIAQKQKNISELKRENESIAKGGMRSYSDWWKLRGNDFMHGLDSYGALRKHPGPASEEIAYGSEGISTYKSNVKIQEGYKQEIDRLNKRIEEIENGGSIADSNNAITAGKKIDEYEKSYATSLLPDYEKQRNSILEETNSMVAEQYKLYLKSELNAGEYMDRYSRIIRIGNEKIKALNTEFHNKQLEEERKIAAEKLRIKEEEEKKLAELQKRSNDTEKKWSEATKSELAKRIQSIKEETIAYKENLLEQLKIAQDKGDINEGKKVQDKLNNADLGAQARITVELEKYSKDRGLDTNSMNLLYLKSQHATALKQGDTESATILGDTIKQQEQEAKYNELDRLQSTLQEQYKAIKEIQKQPISVERNEKLYDAIGKFGDTKESFESYINSIPQDTIDSTEKMVSTSGTFNAYQAIASGSDTYQKVVSDSVKSSAKSTKNIENIIKNNGIIGVFG